MTVFLSILIILTAAVLLTQVARALSVPYPTFLAIGGAVLAFLPDAPSFQFDPSLALVIFVAPVLVGAAFVTSLRDLKDYQFSIIVMVVLAVSVTTAAVAIVFHWLVPGVPWAAAIALGAIVAPPDAAAASAVLRGMKIPRRVRTILEGESLFNDASALLIFAVAVRVAQNGDVSLAPLIASYTASVAGSIALGLALSRVLPFVLRLTSDVPSSIVMQLCSTFGVWLLAEFLQFSPILTVVVYGIGLAHPRAETASPRPLLRAKSAAVWETVLFLANVLAFVLIGMQLAPLLATLNPSQSADYFLIGGAILATAIITRFVGVMSYNALFRLLFPRFAHAIPERIHMPTAKDGVIISWAGMRGIVSLAAALALPHDFPERHLILFASFVVILGTLVLQGLTLGPLVRRLQLPEDRLLDKELALARRRSLEAAIEALDGNTTPQAEALRQEYQALLDLGTGQDIGDLKALTVHERLRVKASTAARKAVRKLHAEGQIGEIAFRRIDAALDRAFLYATRYNAAE